MRIWKKKDTAKSEREQRVRLRESAINPREEKGRRTGEHLEKKKLEKRERRNEKRERKLEREPFFLLSYFLTNLSL